MRPLILALVVASLGCGAAQPPVLARRLGGVRTIGHFVAPYQYEWFVRAELAVARGNLEAAADAYEMALSGAEVDPYVLALLADVLDQLGRSDEADARIEEGLEVDPESEAIALARGRIAERRHHLEEAARAYEDAERFAPRSDRGPLELSRVLRALGAEARADAVLRRFAIRAGRGTPGALRARLALALARGDGENAARVAEALLRIAPARHGEIHRAAEAALQSEEPSLASRLVDALPRTDEHASLRARALVAAGRLEEAEALLASLSADVFGGAVAEARLFLEVGRPDRAEELALGVARGAGPSDAWLVLGKAVLAQGRYAEAAEHLARVPRGVAGFAEARVALAEALGARGDDALACEVLGATLEGDVDDRAAVRRALVLMRLRSGDAAGALAAVGHADDATSMALRARVLERIGREDEALETWVRVPLDESLDPPSRARARAEQLVRGGDEDGALRTLRRLTSRTPTDLEARARLAELLYESAPDEAAAMAAALRPLIGDAPLRARLDPLRAP